MIDDGLLKKKAGSTANRPSSIINRQFRGVSGFYTGRPIF
jgi:hypothetical protein